MNQYVMDRSDISVSSPDELAAEDKAYWKNATAREKLETITWLRECFYGPEATTGRLQGIYSFAQQK